MMADPGCEAIEAHTAVGFRQWVFDPFTYVAGGKSLAIGLTAILLAGLVGAWSKTHFDGVLDVHTGRNAEIRDFLAEGVIDWICLAAVLLLLGKIVSRTAFRTRDVFGTQAMARWPSLIIALSALAPPYRRYADYMAWKLGMVGEVADVASTDVLFFGLVVLAVILVTVWMVWLMYRAYSICCNLSGSRAVGTFIAGLIAAEAISKLAVARMLVH